MESNTINVVVVEGKKIEKTIALHQGKMSGPVTIDAVDNGKYILAEDGTGLAPENITVTHVGDDLYISLEGGDTDHPDLIIRDYYLNEGELVGKGEDGSYYNYVSSQGQDTEVLSAGSTEPLALGNDSIPGFGEGLIAENDDHTLLWALLGLGALAVAGGAIALSNRHDDHHSSTQSAPLPVTVKSGTLDAITDNVGNITGAIADKGVTDDSKPVMTGSGVTPGDTVYILDTDNSVIGTTSAGLDGKWSFTPDTALAEGVHDVKVVVVDMNGNQSDLSNDIHIIVDTIAPGAADNIAVEGDTNTPKITGDAEANSVVIISDNGTEIGSAQVDGDGKWSFTPTTPLDDGDHDITTVVVDEAGNVSPKSTDVPFSVDPDNGGDGGDGTEVPDAATNVQVTNDAGDSLAGKDTSDNTPTISGDAAPDTVVIISNNGTEIGSAQVDENGKWNFTPTDPLAEGDQDITTVVEAADGSTSAPGEDVIFTVDTVAPAAAANLDLEDNYGDVTGPVAENDTTDDSSPVLSGTAEPDAIVTVSDNGNVIGSAQVDAEGNWTFKPTTALDDGAHSLTTVVEDAAGNQSLPSEAMDFTVDTSANPVPSVGFENFENVDAHSFDSIGDSIHLDSGMTLTLKNGPVVGEGVNSDFTAITPKGVILFTPGFGTQDLQILENTDLQVSFDTPTSNVSFDTWANSFAGSTVTFYDANGVELQEVDIPVNAAYQTIPYTAPAGESIASMIIHTSPGTVGNVMTRFDNFKFGPDASLAATHEATPDVQTLAQHFSQESVTGFDFAALGNAHPGIVAVHGHELLNIDQLLSHASHNMFIDDGKDQVAITGDMDSHVEFDAASLSQAHDWSSEGQVTSGGMVYDVYQQHDSHFELLIQHGLDVQHA